MFRLSTKTVLVSQPKPPAIPWQKTSGVIVFIPNLFLYGTIGRANNLIYPFIMTATTTEIVEVDLEMLDRAIEENVGTSNVMNGIINFKLYNPKIGKDIEEDKANKFRVVEPGKSDPVYEEGPFTFNPLDIAYAFSGAVYPLLDNGTYADTKVFFSTSEFGKFAKPTDVLGFSANSKGIGFFQKAQLELMLRTPKLNGNENHFYLKKKDKDDKPYNASEISKTGVIYGVFSNGPRGGEVFRMFISPNHLGITFKAGEVCDPEPGTFEYAVNQGLEEMNALLVANGKKTIRSIRANQCDIRLSIRQNEKKVFLPVFEYAGLVAKRGGNNIDLIEYIRGLKAEHFKSIFGMEEPAAMISIEGTNAQVTMKPLQLKAPKEAETDFKKADTAQQVFDDNMDAPDF